MVNSVCVTNEFIDKNFDASWNIERSIGREQSTKKDTHLALEFNQVGVESSTVYDKPDRLLITIHRILISASDEREYFTRGFPGRQAAARYVNSRAREILIMRVRLPCAFFSSSFSSARPFLVFVVNPLWNALSFAPGIWKKKKILFSKGFFYWLNINRISRLRES